MQIDSQVATSRAAQKFEVIEQDNDEMGREEPDERWTNWGFTIRRCFVEFIGDLIFIFIGSLSFAMPMGEVSVLGAAFAHGITIAILIASLGHISGGHFNPAVTLGVAVSGNIHPILASLYMVSQLLGGFVGALLVRAAMTAAMYCDIGGGTTNINLRSAEIGNGVLVEIILTYLLVQSVLAAAVDSGGKNVLAPLAIGFSVLVDICAGGLFSGASMNPARSFGPAVAYSMLNQNITTTAHPHGCMLPGAVWENHYIHWIGPLIGGAIAGVIYKLILAKDEKRFLFRN